MGYQVYEVGPRFGGYGVPTICEYPTCKKKIDRGMSYACGEEPFSEFGCDRYFCDDHRHYTGFKCDGSDERCDHEEDCECTFKNVCERCRDEKPSFDYKPETKVWMRFQLKDPSWKEWRDENPEKVEEYKKLLKIKK